MTVLAIDQGTSATKALVVTPDGQVAARASAPVTPRAADRGAVTQDADALLQSILEAGCRALADYGGPVDAIGLGNQGETVLAWDRATGEPLGPALSWQDRQASPVVEALKPYAERLRRITGLPLDPYFAAPKMSLLARRHPRATVTTIDTWTLHRLTGEFATDVTTASRTMLLELESCDWSREACEAFDIDPASVPRITDCAEPVGETSAFGGAALPVTALCVDQQAALLAERCLSRGEAKCTYGTGAFMLANAGSDPPANQSPTGLSASVAWRAQGELSYCLDGQVYTAGSAITWLIQLGLIGSLEELDRVRPGPPEATFVPSLAGLGSPFWSPSARGGWLDLTLATTSEGMIRAVIEGVAAQVAWLGRSVEEEFGASIPVLRADGGLTNSRALMQAQADLLQRPVQVYPHQDATALGIAALAALGAGLADSLDESVAPWQPAAEYEATLSPDEAQSRLEVWRSAAQALAERGTSR